MAEETAEKPVVESFQLDHTKVKAPYVRYIDTETGPHGDVISNYDLRLTQPNKQAIPTGGLHTIEHTIAVLLRERIPGYIDCSPFGCRTGFHLLTWGTHPTEEVAKALKEIGAASQTEIDQAQLQLSSAQATRNSTLAQLEAGVQSAKSSLEQVSTALENVDAQGNVVAPMTGTLVTMNAVENAFVSTAMPVAVIDGADQMKVEVSVAETLVPKLAAGDEAEVSVSAAGVSFTGTIRSVERAADQQTKLYTVTLSVPAEVEGLLSGMFADVTFRTDVSENALVIPTEAILTNGQTQYVYVVEEDTARYTEVTTGLTGSGVTEITSGLTEGDQLVTVGQTYLSDGDPVRIVSGEA